MRLLVRVGLLVCCLLLAAPAGAGAAAFTVNTTVDQIDDDPGDGVCDVDFGLPLNCSLRAALDEANFNPDTDSIAVPAGTYALTLDGGGVPSDFAGDLDILNPTTITGAGPRDTIIQGLPNSGPQDRVFRAFAANPTISDLTITGGRQSPDGLGGGAIMVPFGFNVLLSNVSITDNETSFDGGAIGGYGNVILDESYLGDNSAASGRGGAIYAERNVTIHNTTFVNNDANQGGAIAADTANANVDVFWSTFTGNTASIDGQALWNNGPVGGLQVGTDVIAQNGIGAQCGGPAAVTSNGFTVSSDATCGNDPDDLQNATLQLGTIGDNGGPTNTVALLAASPARDLVPAVQCGVGNDQVGNTRPENGLCDAGAYEAAAVAGPPPPPGGGGGPTPPSGGTPAAPALITLSPASATRKPGDANTITATVTTAGGSPSIGTAISWRVTGSNPTTGSATTNSAGQAVISWDGVRDGRDTLVVSTTGSIQATGVVEWVLPPPQIRKSVNIEPVSGTVLVKLPKGAKLNKRDSWAVAAQNGFIPLEQAKNVPINTIVNANRGRIELTSAQNKSPGQTQTGQFYSGQFQIRQTSGAKPITELAMNSSFTCPKSKRKDDVTAAARSRSLWGNARGRFRTRGRNSTATVRGTTWYTKDTCTTTTTLVREGTVTVFDFAKKKNFRVSKGKKYVARAKPARKRR